MNPEPKDQTPNPYVLIALCSGGASAAIAFFALMMFPHVSGSESAIWAVACMIAAMVAAPAAMGIGVAYFLSKHSQQASSSGRSQSSP